MIQENPDAVGPSVEADPSEVQSTATAEPTEADHRAAPSDPVVANATPIAEAAAIVRAVNNPSLRTMMDASAITAHETQSLEALAAEWLPTGLIAHVQVNDRNRRGPGQGDVKFAPFFRELRRQKYDGWIAMEPFDYVPDGAGSAAQRTDL